MFEICWIKALFKRVGKRSTALENIFIRNDSID